MHVCVVCADFLAVCSARRRRHADYSEVFARRLCIGKGDADVNTDADSSGEDADSAEDEAFSADSCRDGEQFDVVSLGRPEHAICLYDLLDVLEVRQWLDDLLDVLASREPQ